MFPTSPSIKMFPVFRLSRKQLLESFRVFRLEKEIIGHG